MNKNLLASVILLTVSATTFAGGLLTNTNQNIAFLRNPARDASTQIDAVYSNPAGLAFLYKDGFHISLNGQSAFQTRTIISTFAPFLMNTDGKTTGEGTRVYKGEASAPFIPSIQAAYKRDKWAFSAGFAVTGGGGKATFNQGLGSFESQVALIPLGLSMNTPAIPTKNYSVDSYMQGKQYIFGLQLGATYKITDYLSAFVGARMNYVSNGYVGYIKNIKVNPNMPALGLNGDMVSASDLFKKLGKEELSKQAADKELDCDQTGWGVTPILGVDFKMNKWNIGVKYEFNTKLNVENKTKIDDTGLFKDGVNTPHDIPSLLTVGVSYEILPVLRASIGYHHFFDTHARMAEVKDPATGNMVGKQKFISQGTNEYLAGLEWDVCKWVQISAGMQRTKYGLEDDYMSDMSFTTSSYSYGFGAGFNITQDLKLNVAYFWTNYEDYKKETNNYNGTGLPGTDVFTRTNKVFGIGLDYRF